MSLTLLVTSNGFVAVFNVVSIREGGRMALSPVNALAWNTGKRSTADLVKRMMRSRFCCNSLELPQIWIVVGCRRFFGLLCCICDVEVVGSVVVLIVVGCGTSRSVRPARLDLDGATV